MINFIKGVQFTISMNKHYFVAHGVDVDGIASHAMGSIKLKPEHIFVDHPTVLAELKKLEQKPKGDIIVADMSFSGKEPIYEVLQRLAKKHNLQAIYDHHQWDKNDPSLSLFKTYRLEQNMCGAEIVRAEFRLRDDVTKELAVLAHVSDFQIKDASEYQTAVNLNKTILLSNNGKGPSLDRIVSTLAQGGLRQLEIDELAGQYDLETQVAKRNLDQSLIERDVEGRLVYFGFSHPILYMKEASFYLLKEYPEADVVVTIFTKPPVKGSLITYIPERNMGQIDIPGYCLANKGGGRQDGGGFLVKPVELKNREALADKLSEGLKAYIK